ncbi:MAG: hypothetical protein KGO48_17010 [Alphaproteobacteria bacterium]|nr:hypothetical protein [Alphaproteobacteria bacterium]
MSPNTLVIAAVVAAVALGAAATIHWAGYAQPYGGFGYGYRPGPGMMGGYGPGIVGGYGMGPGVMGGYGMGMMGARNRACNPDGSVPNFGFRRNAGALNLSAEDVKDYIESRIAWSGNPNVKAGDIKERDANSITATIVTQNNSLVSEFAFDRHTGFSCFVVARK